MSFYFQVNVADTCINSRVIVSNRLASLVSAIISCIMLYREAYRSVDHSAAISSKSNGYCRCRYGRLQHLNLL